MLYCTVRNESDSESESEYPAVRGAAQSGAAREMPTLVKQQEIDADATQRNAGLRKRERKRTAKRYLVFSVRFRMEKEKAKNGRRREKFQPKLQKEFRTRARQQ